MFVILKHTLSKLIKKIRATWISYKKDVLFKAGCNIGLSSTFEGKNVLHNNVIFQDSSIGFGSFIGPDCIIFGTNIGKYCSIASGMKIISGTHPSSTFVSTHPAFYSLLKQAGFTYVTNQMFDEIKYSDEETRRYATIGNDVWIGADVKILGGVTVGNGAIIGANSLVTTNIEPYAVVGGTPAKVIRYRFTKEQIEFLTNFQWWNKSEKWLRDNSDYFKDIELLFDRYNNQER